jgi:hypothetical protein
MKDKALIASSEVPSCNCPTCGNLLEAVTGATIGSLDRPTPQPGSPSVCGYCGEILMFDSAMRARLADRAVARRLIAENPILADLQRKIRNGDFTTKCGKKA